MYDDTAYDEEICDDETRTLEEGLTWLRCGHGKNIGGVNVATSGTV